MRGNLLKWHALVVCGLASCVSPTAGPPNPTAIEPSSATEGTATPITITGRFSPEVVVNYRSGSRVDTDFLARLGGVDLEAVTYVDQQTLSATVPGHLPTGIHDLEVTDPHGRVGVLTRAFEVVACAGGVLPALETCDDGRDDDCDGDIDESDCAPDWWDCGFGFRIPITIDPAPLDVATGYSIAVVLDHSALVTAGRSRPDGADVRVVVSDVDGRRELDRVVDPDSSWNSASTTVWFALERAIPAGRTDTAYALYTGPVTTTSPAADEAAVFHFADFFDRANADDPGHGWELTEAPGDIDIDANALRFVVTADTDNRPVADHPFTAMSGRMSWRFGFDWQREVVENNYRVHMQLGASAAMELPQQIDDLTNLGIGPSLVWSGPNDGMVHHEGFGYEVAGTLAEVQVVSGFATIEAVVDSVAQTFDLCINGALSATGLPFSSARASLDRVRFVTWQLNEQYFAAPRSFTHLIVRPLQTPEPAATLGPIEPSGC